MRLLALFAQKLTLATPKHAGNFFRTLAILIWLTPTAWADGYDIYLYELSTPSASQTTWHIGPPQVVAAREGYDNQASFNPESSAVVFASNRDNPKGFNDIYQFDITTGEIVKLTDTPNLSEFSPQWHADELVYVVEQGVPHQSVWLQRDGQQAQRAINSLIPTGYYAKHPQLGTLLWARYAYSLYFEPQGQQADERHFVVNNAGRSIHVIPNTTQFSYLHKQLDGDWVIKAYDPIKQAQQNIIALTGGSEDYAWTHNHWILNMQGNTLRGAHFQGQPLTNWQTLSQLTPPTATHHSPSRLSVSPDNRYLTVVWQRQTNQ